MRRIIRDLKDKGETFNEYCLFVENELKKKLGANKIKIMRESLDMYIELPAKCEKPEQLCELCDGVLTGIYLMEDGRYTYCISLKKCGWDSYGRF